jgi:MATE family multidrug resistance protein
MRGFLNYLGKSKIPLKNIPITIVLHFLWCYIFVVRLDYGVKGVGIATSITYSLNSITTFLLAYIDKDLKEAMLWPNRDSLKGMWNFWKIGIPSAALNCFDVWCFEIMMLLSGYLSTDETAA